MTAKANGCNWGGSCPAAFRSRYLPVGFQAGRTDRREANGERWWLAAVHRLNIGVEMVEYLGLCFGPPLQTNMPFPLGIERHEQ
jgi:hypothetical protein